MTAPAFPTGALGPAQQAALHVGPQDALPFDPRALVLYGRCGGDPKDGFAAGALDQIEIEPCHMLMELAPAPGAGRGLIEASGSFGGLKPPLSVAAAAGGTIYLADRGNALVKYFDPCDCAFKPLPCISTAPAATTNTHQFVPLDRLSDPVGLAVSGAQLLIADRGHHRIVIVGLVGAVPRASLRLPGSTGLRALWSPFAIAVDSGRRIYVSDPDHARLDLFSPEGRWLQGWTAMGAVGSLAIDCDDRLYAVIGDYARDGAGNPAPAAVEISDGAIKPISDTVARLRTRFACNPAPNDNAGRLHLRCASGQAAIFDLQGLPVAEKNAAALLPVAKTGSYRSKPLDSRRRGCIWHRVVLTGHLPAKTRIDVQTTTSDVALNDAELADLPAQAWSALISIRSMAGGVADCLVMSPPGRYLWLKLVFAGDGRSTPRVSRIVIEYPRVSLRRYLPAVFGMDPVSADFTDRFTALFDTTLRSIERRIDTFHELFDPATAPAADPRGNPASDFLSWLASWIGVTLGSQWPEPLRRAMLKAAPKLYTLRGTRYGLWRQLLVFLGLERSCDSACEVTRCKALPLNCAPTAGPLPQRTAAAHPRAFQAETLAVPRGRQAGRRLRAVGPAHRQPKPARLQRPRRPADVSARPTTRDPTHLDARSATRSVPRLCQPLQRVRTGPGKEAELAAQGTRKASRAGVSCRSGMADRVRRAALPRGRASDDRTRFGDRARAVGHQAQRQLTRTRRRASAAAFVADAYG